MSSPKAVIPFGPSPESRRGIRLQPDSQERIRLKADSTREGNLKADPTAGGQLPSRRSRVLVVDDERSMRELLSIVLAREGYEVVVAESGAAAIAALGRQPFDLLISDIRMPDVGGVDVLRAAKQADPDITGIMMTAFASAETAVEALRLGASDYLTKPFDVDELKIVVRQALERRALRQENVALKRALNTPHRFVDMIGRSEPMLAVFRLIETIAPTTSTVLVTGESGTGKELAARAIHYHSLRRDRPFVALNCGALTETLLESELFGHMRGAFTGAATNKKGLIEVAEKGTIFLDEISETSPQMQVKLLRVIQERTFRRVGGTEEIAADIRVIAASNRDLPTEVAEGRFREDLYYRINVIPLHLPPLRERREDVALLAEHFVERFARQMNKPLAGLSRDAVACLERYAWPGNIRELENALERAVALEHTPTILPESLPTAVLGAVGVPCGAAFVSRAPSPARGGATEAGASSAAGPASSVVEVAASGSAVVGSGLSRTDSDPSALPWPEGEFDLERHVREIERQYIAAALQRANGVKVKAAASLGMSFRSFRYYLKKYGLS